MNPANYFYQHLILNYIQAIVGRLNPLTAISNHSLLCERRNFAYYLQDHSNQKGNRVPLRLYIYPLVFTGMFSGDYRHECHQIKVVHLSTRIHHPTGIGTSENHLLRLPRLLYFHMDGNLFCRQV